MLEHVADQTSLCAACPRMCRHACPVSNAERRETVTPALKMTAVDLARREVIPLDGELAAVTSACTSCGACSQFCKLGNNVAEVLVEARVPLARAGVSPVAQRVSEHMDRTGNPTGSDLGRLHRQRVPARPEKGALALWPGCTALRRLPEHVSDVIAVTERAMGHAMAVVPPDPEAACCGYPLWAAGLHERFAVQARQVAAHVKGRGGLVTSDPGCAWTFNVLYPRVGAPLEQPARHVSQLLGTLALPSTWSGPAPLYHDPCHLGRHLGVYDEPRAALERSLGVKPREFTWNRANAECCGGGGLYPHANRAGALEAARRRVSHEVDERQRTGADVVVTACPGCELMFNRAGVPAVDLARALLGKRTPGPRTEGGAR